MKIKTKNFGFTIIEILVAIFIFSLAMASIFMLINGTLNANNLSKNQVIASNLAREQIEIIRNLRDNNYANYRIYNYIPNPSNDFSKKIEIGKYYKIENDFSDPKNNYKIDEINDFSENKKDLKTKMKNYKLFLDSNNNYSYNNSGKETIFYRFLKTEKLVDDSGKEINNAIKITSKVIWYSKGYHEFEIKTILANFNRL